MLETSFEIVVTMFPSDTKKRGFYPLEYFLDEVAHIRFYRKINSYQRKGQVRAQHYYRSSSVPTSRPCLPFS
jgi:hypothetical protein